MRQNLSNIRIRGTVYHYRRRVPPKLVPILGQTEIIRSLETSSAREARRRASAMNVETDRAFKQMSQVSLAEEQVATIVRRLKKMNSSGIPPRERKSSPGMSMATTGRLIGYSPSAALR